MHVEMPDRAVARVDGVERLLQLLPIEPPAALDTGVEARHRERPGQQRPAIVGAVAEQTDAERGLRPGIERLRPDPLEQRWIDVVEPPVGIDVGAGKPRRSEERRGGKEWVSTGRLWWSP